MGAAAAAAGLCRERDAQALRIALRGGEESAGRRGQQQAPADFAACGRVEQRRAVAHRAGDHMIVDEAEQDLVQVGAGRIASARGLQTKEPAVRRRHADRAGAVGRVTHGRDAGGHGRRRAAARAPGAAADIPRIAGGSRREGFRGYIVADLGRRGPADGDQASPLVALGELRIVRRDVAFHQPAARLARNSLVRGADVLDEKGHAGKRGARRHALK